MGKVTVILHTDQSGDVHHQHHPASHCLTPAGNVASAAAGIQPWHLECLGLMLEEKASVATKQNKTLLSGTFWTCSIPQPP